MIENITNLTSASFSESYVGNVLLAILIGVMIVVFSLEQTFLWLGRRKRSKMAVGRVRRTLVDFATSWATLRKNEKVNLEHKSIPMLQKGENIKIIVMGVSSELPEAYAVEALDIANQLIRVKGEVERSMHSGVITRGQFYKKDEIDQLAERAKECALKMGGKTK